MAPRSAAGMGQTLVRLGRADEAYTFIKQVMSDEIYHYGGRINLVYLNAALAEAAVVTGRRDEAIGFAERAVEYGRSHQEPTSVAVAMLTYADVLRTIGDDPTKARQLYECTLELGARHELRPACAFSKAGLALLDASFEKRALQAKAYEVKDVFNALTLDFTANKFEDVFLQHSHGSKPYWFHNLV